MRDSFVANRKVVAVFLGSVVFLFVLALGSMLIQILKPAKIVQRSVPYISPEKFITPIHELAGIPTVALPTPTPTPSYEKLIDWWEKPQPMGKEKLFEIVDRYYPQQIVYAKSFEDSTEIIEKIYYQPKAEYFKVGMVRKGTYLGNPVYLAIVNNLPFIRVKCLTFEKKCYSYDYAGAYLFTKDNQGQYILSDDYNSKNLFDPSARFEGPGPAETHIPRGEQGIIFEEGLVFDPASKKINFAIQVGNGEYTFNLEDLSARERKFFVEEGKYFIGELDWGAKLFVDQNITADELPLERIMNIHYEVRFPSGLSEGVVLSSMENPLEFGWLSSEEAPEKAKIVFPVSRDEFAGTVGHRGIAWKNRGNYYTDYYGGCRFVYNKNQSNAFYSFFEKEMVNFRNSTVELSVNERGDRLYELQDKNDPIYAHFFRYYQQLTVPDFESRYLPITPINEIEEFVSYHPLIIWENGFGVKQLLYLQAFTDICGGEPLIYLYPEEEQEIKIEIGGAQLVKTVPEYRNGWFVKANPQGKIVDLEKGGDYRYLFWEGVLSRASLADKPVKVLVVRRENIPYVLRRELAEFGLVESEIENFVGFWVEKLRVAPSYVLYFWDAKVLQQTIPLRVSPEPDTMIRVLMDYQEVWEKGVEEVELNNALFTKPKRRGFTVVEAGGILHR